MLGYRFRVYPSKAAQAELLGHIGLYRRICNRILSELEFANKKGIKLKLVETQAPIANLKKTQKLRIVRS